MAEPAPRILVTGEKPGKQSFMASTPGTAWRMVGWFGLMLAVIGAVDIALNWYPTAFSSREWEFGTVAVSFGSMPLMTMGLAALFASFLARGSRLGVLVMTFVFLLLLVWVVCCYILFLLDVPIALQVARGATALPIKKAIAKTTVMGLGFGLVYLGAVVVSFKVLKRRVADA